MGSEDEDFKRQTYQKNQTNYTKLKILIFIILTNLLTFYIFSNPTSYPNFQNLKLLSSEPSLSKWDTTTLLLKLNSTQDELETSHVQILDLQMKLKSTKSLVEKLLTQLSRLNGAIDQSSETAETKDPEFDDLLFDTTKEVKLAIGSHKLPLGYNPKMGADEIYSSVGGACLKYKNDLKRYMTYPIGGECPSDDNFAQTLLLKGCEPLPRRRCHPKSPKNYVDPTPLPDSLWSMPADTSLNWDAYKCKNYKCLMDRRKTKVFYDCNDCFYLQGREKNRWHTDNGALDFGIDEVLATKPEGTVRIGLDIGGGSGTFAARMRERNVTIVSTSMNFDGPFNSFISSRGLLSMHMSISQRLPFYEHTLDIVHSMHVLSNWIPNPMLESILYDIYRVLRPGGLFWLDRFFCTEPQLNSTYVPLFDRVGFNQLRWYSGAKLDKGADKKEWYISALLEKPMT